MSTPCTNANLEAQIKALQVEISSFHNLMDERDRRYEGALGSAKEAIKVAMDAADKAVTKAESAAERRFESVNEFRGQMADMQQTFARSDVVDTKMRALDEKINELLRTREKSVGRGSAFGDVWTWALGAALLGAAIAKLFL